MPILVPAPSSTFPLDAARGPLHEPIVLISLGQAEVNPSQVMSMEIFFPFMYIYVHVYIYMYIYIISLYIYMCARHSIMTIFYFNDLQI